MKCNSGGFRTASRVICGLLIVGLLAAASVAGQTISRDQEKAVINKLLSYSGFEENQMHALSLMILEGDKVKAILDKKPDTKEILFKIMGYGEASSMKLAGQDPLRVAEDIREICKEMDEKLGDSNVRYYVEKVTNSFTVVRYALEELWSLQDQEIPALSLRL